MPVLIKKLNPGMEQSKFLKKAWVYWCKRPDNGNRCPKWGSRECARLFRTLGSARVCLLGLRRYGHVSPEDTIVLVVEEAEGKEKEE
jgi:hypothetical protein